MAIAPKSERLLGGLQLFALGVNGTIGVGIFFAPSQVAAVAPGGWGLLVYLLVLVGLIPIALVYAALGARFAENGGPYVWARAAFGSGAGFLLGWLTYVSAIFSAAAVVSGFSEHAGAAFGLQSSFEVRTFASVLIVLLTLVVLSGLKPSAGVWSAFTVAKLVPLVVLLVLFGFASSRALPTTSQDVKPGALTRAALVVVFALQGFEVVPVLARNTKASSRVIPWATLSSLLCVGGLYLLIHWAAVAALPDLRASSQPLVDTGEKLGGSLGRQLLFVGTNVSALGIAFGMFAVTPHYLAALGREPGFGWVAAKEVVPRRAVFVTALAVLVAVLSGELAQLFVLSSVAVMAQYLVSGLALVGLAFRRTHGLTPRHAWPAPLGFGAIALLLTGAELDELFVAGGVVALGSALYWACRRVSVGPV